MKFSLLALPALVAASPAALDPCTVTCTKYGIDANEAATVSREFNAQHVVPDVVPAIDPKTELRGAYGSKQISLGNTFNIAETLQAPTFDFNPEKDHDPETTRYTFVIVDPDAPGPQLPILRQFLHMIVSDTAPSCVANAKPKTVAPYMPLTPLSVAQHRYTLLIFRQPPGPFNPVVPGGAVTLAARAPFNLQEFVTKNNLTLVGGNFFKEGLANVVGASVPGHTADGTGYNGPKDGTAEPASGIGNLL